MAGRNTIGGRNDMCTTNSEPKHELYCRTEKKIVDKDHAALWCYQDGHDVIESDDDLFSDGAV